MAIPLMLPNLLKVTELLIKREVAESPTVIRELIKTSTKMSTNQRSWVL